MDKDGYLFDFDCISKFYHSLYVRGWFHHPDDKLQSVRIECTGVLSVFDHVGTHHGGVTNLGPNKGFDIQLLRDTDGFDEGATITFKTAKGHQIVLSRLYVTTEAQTRGWSLTDKFKSVLGGRLLDIGGRARSGYDWRQ